MVLDGGKETQRNVPLLRRHVVCDCAHRQARVFQALSEGQAFPGNLNLPQNNRKGTIYHRHAHLCGTGSYQGLISEEL